MFERYNESARRVVLLSRSRASELGCAAIEPCHILLAILQEDPELFQEWSQREEDLESLRALVEEQARVNAGTLGDGGIRLSPEAQQLLASSAEEADRLKDSEIRPFHLLAALLSGSSATAEAMRGASTTPPDTRLVFVASSHARADAITEADDLIRLIGQLPRSQLGRARMLLQALLETGQNGRQE